MNSLFAAMLVIFGFLLAALLLLVVLPSYRRRVERLSTQALKRALPLTESEIRAEKDRLRAEYAINLHRLEKQLGEAEYSAARQSIEINRREAKINDLELAIAQHKGSVEEHENARRVLEQAILDRLPKVEQRLADTRKLLSDRDSEIATLVDTSTAQTAALQEATQINVQQNDELNRMRTALETRAARNRETLGDPRFDGEVALRTEIEMLRAKSRDQSDMIERLQTATASGAATEDGGLSAEVKRLKSELGKAESELLTLKSGEGSEEGVRAALEKRVGELIAQEQTRVAELAKLKAAVKTYEDNASQAQAAIGSGSLSAKAELSALQAEIDEQRRVISGLRAEVASSNERLARQSQHFRDELRRLGSAGLGLGAESARRDAETARPSLAERISQPRAPMATVNGLSETSVANGSDATADASLAGKVAYLKPLNGGADGATSDAKPEAANDAASEAPKRTRLLDRISSVEKS